jgi:hypothetical protein
MMPNDYRAKESAKMFDLAVKLRTAILYSIAQSLAAQFPPPEDPPAELRKILERIEEI